jgi:hypothetical protein
MNLDLICARLANNLETFRSLTTNLSSDEIYWKPSADQWSIIEIINHLADEEAEDFRTRVRLTLESPTPPWPPIDPEGWVVQRKYQERQLEQSMARFDKERRESLSWLRSLDSPDFDSVASHPEYGSITAGSLLASWLAHDYLHIRQITRNLYEYHAQTTPYDTQYAGRW